MLLVWDAPNMDMSLGSLLGARPTSAFRPRFDAVGRWLLDLAGRHAVAEAMRVHQRRAGQHRGGPAVGGGAAQRRLRRLRQAEDQPKTPISTTTCSAHIELRADEGHAASTWSSRRATGGRSASRWRSCARDGTYVTVIGFREHASFALTSEVIEFVDLEDIEGVFREPLPRITLDSLPDGGAWLPPFRSLRSLLEPRR